MLLSRILSQKRIRTFCSHSTKTCLIFTASSSTLDLPRTHVKTRAKGWAMSLTHSWMNEYPCVRSIYCFQGVLECTKWWRIFLWVTEQEIMHACVVLFFLFSSLIKLKKRVGLFYCHRRFDEVDHTYSNLWNI